MDISNVLGAESEPVEEYKIYMYGMFAKELARSIRRYVHGKVYVEPNVEQNTLIVSITNTIEEGPFKGQVDYTCQIKDAIDLMKNDGARDASKAVVKEYKDQIWHTFCKVGGKHFDKSEKEAAPVKKPLKVNHYDDDVRRLHFKEHMSVEQISDALSLHVDQVNKVLEGLIGDAE